MQENRTGILRLRVEGARLRTTVLWETARRVQYYGWRKSRQEVAYAETIVVRLQ